MKGSLGAIVLIGVVLSSLKLIALAAVATSDGAGAAYYAADLPGSQYHGPENFWAE